MDVPLTTAKLAPTAAITQVRVTGGMSVIHCSTGCAMVGRVPTLQRQIGRDHVSMLETLATMVIESRRC